MPMLLKMQIKIFCGRFFIGYIFQKKKPSKMLQELLFWTKRSGILLDENGSPSPH